MEWNRMELRRWKKMAVKWNVHVRRRGKRGRSQGERKWQSGTEIERGQRSRDAERGRGEAKWTTNQSRSFRATKS